MPDDSFPVEMAGGVPVVAALEEIDITNAGALRSALLTAAASGPAALVVDMTRTRFCDSSGLHMRIPIDSDHSFRSNPIADSGVSDHLAGVGVS